MTTKKEARNLALIESYKSGSSMNDLSEFYKITRQRVQQILGRSGVMGLRNCSKLLSEKKLQQNTAYVQRTELICSMRKDGLLGKEIAANLHLSPAVVSKVLLANDLSKPVRRFKVSEDGSKSFYCVHCKQYLHENQFPHYASGHGQPYSVCRNCVSKYSNLSARKNWERTLSYHRKWDKQRKLRKQQEQQLTNNLPQVIMSTSVSDQFNTISSLETNNVQI